MTARRGLIIGGVLLVVALLVGGALLVRSRAEEVRTTALVRAAEGTWTCTSDDWDLWVGGRWIIEVDRSGLYRLTFEGDQGDRQETTGIWTLSDGQIAISTFGGTTTWEGLPSGLKDADITGAWNQTGAVPDTFSVSVVSPEKVLLTQKSTSNVVTCAKGSSRRPDIAVGVQD